MLLHRLDRILTSLLLAVLSGGCTEPTLQSGAEHGRVPPALVLPDLPQDGGPRHVSAPTSTRILGWDYFKRSTVGSMQEGTELNLSFEDGQPGWGIYRYAIGGNTPLSLELSMLHGGGEAWLALSDYDAGRWEFHGPYTAALVELELEQRHVSPGGHIYCAVVPYGEPFGQVNVVESVIELDALPLAQHSITGRIVDEFGFSVSGATVFVAFHMVSTTTDANGNYALQGLPTDDELRLIPSLDEFTFEPAMRFIDLSGSLVGVDFEASGFVMPPEVSYALHMRPWVFEPVCMNCHNSAYTTDEERHFAPPWVDWDHYDGTTEFYKNLGLQRATLETMPPTLVFGALKLTAHQKALFQAWADDGFPP